MHNGRARQHWLGGIVLALIGLTLACNDTAVTPSARTLPPAPVVTSSALQPTIDALQVERYAQAIAAQATLDVFHAQQTATAVSVQSTVSAQIWSATATAQAQSAQATATAWQTTVEAAQAQATATAQAQAGQATATVQAQATAQARSEAQAAATATIEARLFEQAFQSTAEARQVQAQATAQALQALATVQAAEARQFELAAEREERINAVKAWTPLALLLVGTGVLIYAIIQIVITDTVRRRNIPRDARGDAPLVPFRAGPVAGFYNEDRAFGPVLVLNPDGTVAQPGFVDPEYQDRVTGRDQLIDLRHRGLPYAAGRAGGPRRLPARWRDERPTPRALPGLQPPREFRALRHAVQAGLLPPQFADAIEADWREIHVGEPDDVPDSLG